MSSRSISKHWTSAVCCKTGLFWKRKWHLIFTLCLHRSGISHFVNVHSTEALKCINATRSDIKEDKDAVLCDNLQKRQLMDVFVAICPTKSWNAQWNVLTFWIRLDCRFCRNAAFYESAQAPRAQFILIHFHNLFRKSCMHIWRFFWSLQKLQSSQDTWKVQIEKVQIKI